MARRVIVIGDIHGCYDELCDLLGRLGPSADDLIVSVGDLVDRGPKPVEVVRFFRDAPNARAILGNHEDKHLRWASGELEPALGQIITKEQAGAAYGELLDYFATLPLLLDLPEAIVVHAGYEPGLEFLPQAELAKRRNVPLRAKPPGARGISGDLEIWASRVVGVGERPVVCGHHAVGPKPAIFGDRVYCIDTAVAHGGRLTALVLPCREIVSVKARADHVSLVFRQYRPVLRELAGAADRRRHEALVPIALEAAGIHLASLPPSSDDGRRRALAQALDRHPLGQDLRPLAFVATAADRERKLRGRFPTLRQLFDAFDRFTGLADGELEPIDHARLSALRALARDATAAPREPGTEDDDG